MTLRKAWRVVRPDFTSRNGYRWPLPGNWAYPNPGQREMTTGDPRPQFDGDGLTLAKTWRGAASGGIPAATALLCEYHPADVLGEDADKLRVRRALVVAVYDPQALVRAGFCANLSGANLTGAHLAGAHLAGVDLYGAHLSRADLTEANLTGANLSRAYLGRADLRGADLSGANLYGADLCGASLMGANLTGANLFGAYVGRADLIGANLTDANLYGWERGPDGFARRILRYEEVS